MSVSAQSSFWFNHQYQFYVMFCLISDFHLSLPFPICNIRNVMYTFTDLCCCILKCLWLGMEGKRYVYCSFVLFLVHLWTHLHHSYLIDAFSVVVSFHFEDFAPHHRWVKFFYWSLTWKFGSFYACALACKPCMSLFFCVEKILEKFCFLCVFQVPL